MKKEKNLSVVAVIVMTVALLNIKHLMGEEQIITKEQKHIAVGNEVAGCQLTISTTNKVFALGKPLVITASLKNVSTNKAPISVTSSYFNLYLLRVVGADIKDVPLTEWGKRVGVNTLSGETLRYVKDLSPGECFDVHFFINELFQMTNSGDYTVTVIRKVGKLDQWGKGLETPSAPLKIWFNEPAKINPEKIQSGAASPTNKANQK